jgi:hypothetical protein
MLKHFSMYPEFVACKRYDASGTILSQLTHSCSSAHTNDWMGFALNILSQFFYEIAYEKKLGREPDISRV